MATNARVIACLLDQLDALKLENARLRGAESTPSDQPNPIAIAICEVVGRIKNVKTSNEVRLVAVSKKKPVQAIVDALQYTGTPPHFGENYVAEILEKAPILPSSINWHFIGHLQSNKAKALVTGVPNLFVVETVDSEKLATMLNKECGKIDRLPLNVMVQVNTSGEESKSGLSPNNNAKDVVALARHIVTACPHLCLLGLMTIGRLGDPSPECFKCLVSCRGQVQQELGLTTQLELSMGMSGDFEMAVELGSTNVRVGSTIFGARK